MDEQCHTAPVAPPAALPVQDETFTFDLQSQLGEALLQAQVALNQRSLQELVFLRNSCSDGEKIAQDILELRPLMGNGLIRRILDAIQSLSVTDLMKQVGFNINR